MRNRFYSFSIPCLMDGALALVQIAMPLLAIRFGADAWFLATTAWIAQGLRLPFCFGAGALSERVGRTRVIIPAAVVFTLMALLLGFTRSKYQVLIVYAVIMPCVGAFYPALQAMIGDVSGRGELRKNISAFNVGWCVGGSVLAMAAGALLEVWQPLPFVSAAAIGLAVAVLVLFWIRGKPRRHADGFSAAAVPGDAIPHVDRLLLIARIGHFLSFFGLAMVKVVYPIIAIKRLGFSETDVAVVIAMMLVGQALGMFVTGAGSWWRGRLWPLTTSLLVMAAASVAAWSSSDKLITGIAFLALGVTLAVVYTGALYYGLQSRRNLGRNSGIHESLVAAGSILGSLAGGAVAELIGLRAPYLMFAGLCGVGLGASGFIWGRGKKRGDTGTRRRGEE